MANRQPIATRKALLVVCKVYKVNKVVLSFFMNFTDLKNLTNTLS